MVVRKIKIIYCLLLASFGFLSAEQSIKDLDAQVGNYYWGRLNYFFQNTSSASDFFIKSNNQDIDVFLKKYPQSFFGLFLRLSRPYNKITHEIFKEWRNCALQKISKTPSLLYLEADNLSRPVDFFNDYNYQEYFLNAWFKEKELCKNYYLFYHGQRAEFGFIQEFTKELIQELYEVGYLYASLPDDFLFIQNCESMNHVINKTVPHNQNIKMHARQKTMLEGRNYNTEPSRVPERLSVNAFLFGGTSRPGATTWEFVVTNSNINYFNIDFKKVCFDALGLSELCAQTYVDEVEQLYTEYKSFYEKGRLIQIAIPKKMIDESVYIASDGAYKDCVYTKFGKKITTVSDFFYHLESGDYSVLKVHAEQGHLRPGINEVEFAMPLTGANVLNPYTGIKVFGYSCVPCNEIDVSYYCHNSQQWHIKKTTHKEHEEKRKKLCKKIAQMVVK
ncbi:hypothetical protein K9K77_00060 [Candidatus Babeliales bacterium]|nr:hypothetical protein [Candidatus Babeliales bacterium]